MSSEIIKKKLFGNNFYKYKYVNIPKIDLQTKCIKFNFSGYDLKDTKFYTIRENSIIELNINIHDNDMFLINLLKIHKFMMVYKIVPWMNYDQWMLNNPGKSYGMKLNINRIFIFNYI